MLLITYESKSIHAHHIQFRNHGDVKFDGDQNEARVNRL